MPNKLACGDCSMEPLTHPAQETLSSVGQSSGQYKGVVSVRGCKQVESDS